MLDKIDSNTVHNNKKVIYIRKGSKTVVKLVENISKNPQSFLEISPVRKEVLLSRKLQDNAHE